MANSYQGIEAQWQEDTKTSVDTLSYELEEAVLELAHIVAEQRRRARELADRIATHRDRAVLEGDAYDAVDGLSELRILALEITAHVKQDKTE